MVNNTNHRDLEVDMMKWSNIFNAILFQAAGGAVHDDASDDEKVGSEFIKFMESDLVQAMTAAKGTKQTSYYEGTDGLTTDDSLQEPRFAGKTSNATLQIPMSLLCLLALNADMQSPVHATLSTAKSVDLPRREKWRRKIRKAGFYTLKQSHQYNLNWIAYVDEIVTFEWVCGTVVSRLLVRWVKPSGRDEQTDFAVLTLDPSPSVMLPFDAIASPVHVVPYRDTNRNMFLLNETFYE